jgi:phage terminase small subunit
MTQPSRMPSRASDPHLSTHEPARERALTPKQRLFVAEYLVDFSAKDAAIRAGYGERSAHAHGWYLTKLPHVSAAIDRAIEVRAERTRITAHRVLLELARIAFADIGRIIDWSGNALTVKPPGMLSADDRAAISEIAIVVGKKGLAARVTLHDKERALEALCRHLGLFGHMGQFNAGTIESPAAAAERARAIIFERLAKLRQAREAEEAESDEGKDGDLEGQT